MLSFFKSDFFRLGRKNIIPIILVTLFVSFILGSVLVKAQGRPHPDNEEKFFKEISIEDGDSLWSIAKENMDYSHYDSLNDYIDELKTMNNLSTDRIYVGNKLIVTYYAQCK